MFDDWYWGDFEEDIKTTEERDQHAAATAFLEAAHEGDIESGFMYGLCCLYGVGAETDPEEGFSRILHAAELGYEKAFFVIGDLYAGGIGPAGRLPEKERAAEAMKWLLKAAEKGSSDAQWELAHRMKRGELFEKNEEESMIWTKKAAENGNPFAQRALYFECRMKAIDEFEKRKKMKESGKPEPVDSKKKKAVSKKDQISSKKDRISSKKETAVLNVPDFSEALCWLEKSASSGFPAALKDLGDVYSTGLGNIRPDPKKAYVCYKKAAGKDFVPAYAKLADCYLSGSGTKKNVNKAFEYFLKAAEGGDEDGDSGIAACYYMGTGIGKNETAALVWAKGAAEKGNLRCMITTGMFYEAGIADAAPDYDNAGRYFRRAVSEGFLPAEMYLENMTASRRVKTEASMEEISDLEKKAEAGDCDSCLKLAMVYDNDNVLPLISADPEKAFFWFLKAAEAGSIDACAIVADHYLKGNGVSKNRREAFSWYKKAADAGQTTACAIIGTCYEHGFFVRKNPEKAEKYYNGAALGGEIAGEICRCRVHRSAFPEDGNNLLFAMTRYDAVQPDASPRSKNMLADCYEYGIGTKRDMKKAFLWNMRAAVDGFPESQRKIAGFYENGTVSEVSPKTALFWYKKAATGGDSKAAEILGKFYACGKYVRKNKTTALRWFLISVVAEDLENAEKEAEKTEICQDSGVCSIFEDEQESENISEFEGIQDFEYDDDESEKTETFRKELPSPESIYESCINAVKNGDQDAEDALKRAEQKLRKATD